MPRRKSAGERSVAVSGRRQGRDEECAHHLHQAPGRCPSSSRSPAEPPAHHDTSLDLPNPATPPRSRRDAPPTPRPPQRPRRSVHDRSQLGCCFPSSPPAPPPDTRWVSTVVWTLPSRWRGFHRVHLSREGCDATNQEVDCHFPLIEREPAQPWKSLPDPSCLIAPLPFQAPPTLPPPASPLTMLVRPAPASGKTSTAAVSSSDSQRSGSPPREAALPPSESTESRRLPPREERFLLQYGSKLHSYGRDKAPYPASYNREDLEL